jgi:hypothetical protein
LALTATGGTRQNVRSAMRRNSLRTVWCSVLLIPSLVPALAPAPSPPFPLSPPPPPEPTRQKSPKAQLDDESLEAQSRRQHKLPQYERLDPAQQVPAEAARAVLKFASAEEVHRAPALHAQRGKHAATSAGSLPSTCHAIHAKATCNRHDPTDADSVWTRTENSGSY